MSPRRPRRLGRARALGLAAALGLAGCPKPKPDTPDLLREPEVAAPSPAGRMADGVYLDGRWPLSVPVPEGWTAQVGVADDEERVSLADPEGDVRVTVAAVAGGEGSPRELPGCDWAFVDQARYRAVRVRDPVVVATCTPEDPNAPRVLAYIVAQEGVVFHVEGHVPNGRLRAGKADLDTIVGRIRFR